MSPRKLNDDKDMDRGKRLEEERKKIWKSREKYREDTGLSGRTLESFEQRGAGISSDCLAAIAVRGGDIVYILTGKRTAAGAAEAGRGSGKTVSLSSEQARIARDLTALIVTFQQVLQKVLDSEEEAQKVADLVDSLRASAQRARA